MEFCVIPGEQEKLVIFSRWKRPKGLWCRGSPGRGSFSPALQPCYGETGVRITTYTDDVLLHVTSKPVENGTDLRRNSMARLSRWLVNWRLSISLSKYQFY